MNKITKHGLAYYLKDYKQITCPECNSDRILLEIAETYLLPAAGGGYTSEEKYAKLMAETQFKNLSKKGAKTAGYSPTHVEIKGRCCECECEFIHSRHEIELK